MKTVDLVYFNAGGGHRAAALALETAIREQGRPWRVRLVNLTEVLDPQGLFRKVTGFAPEDIYNKRLARGWTLGLAQELKVLQAAIRLAHPKLVRALRVHWLRTEPDLVVSLVPNFNRPLFESVASALPGVPYATVLTDLADYPPRFWIESGQQQHFVCGTHRAIEQARALGHPDHRLHLVSGMILRPDFYREGADDDREARRRQLGLDGVGPVGLVLFGGHGSRAMLRIAQRLPDRPLILMCGHNRALARALREQPATAQRVVVDFTPDVAGWMRLADYFVGKPGPGSISEALQTGLPVIVTLNRSTMPQERYNSQWVQERGVGVVLRSFATIRAAVDDVASRLPELRARVLGIRNHAVFEVPDILHRLLEESERRACAPDEDSVGFVPCAVGPSRIGESDPMRDWSR
jgi:UDP-N-acetylglucosamine:LPS N-acetylglucosamine transferase